MKTKHRLASNSRVSPGRALSDRCVRRARFRRAAALVNQPGYERLIVCHLNHRLRGRSSDADARFVKRLVERYNQEVVGQALRLPSARTSKRSARPTTDGGIEFELGSANIRASQRKRRCRSKLRRVKRAMHSLLKPHGAETAERSSSRITPTIWSKRF
jgi:hypothetical protein